MGNTFCEKHPVIAGLFNAACKKDKPIDPNSRVGLAQQNRNELRAAARSIDEPPPPPPPPPKGPGEI